MSKVRCSHCVCGMVIKGSTAGQVPEFSKLHRLTGPNSFTSAVQQRSPTCLLRPPQLLRTQCRMCRNPEMNGDSLHWHQHQSLTSTFPGITAQLIAANSNTDRSAAFIFRCLCVHHDRPSSGTKTMTIPQLFFYNTLQRQHSCSHIVCVASCTCILKFTKHRYLWISLTAKYSAMQQLSDLYEKFLLNNMHAIGTIESTLRTFLFVAPGRFRDSEMKLEAGTSSHAHSHSPHTPHTTPTQKHNITHHTSHIPHTTHTSLMHTHHNEPQLTLVLD